MNAIDKAGLNNFTRCLAAEWAQYNINVNCIAPGAIDTEMSREDFVDPQFKADFMRAIPKNRFGEPEEVASLALYLASDASEFMLGQILYLDGGHYAKGPDTGNI